MSEITELQRYRGALVGLGLGSALGAPVESMSREQVRIKHGLVTSLLSRGWRGLHRGEHTPEADLALVLGRHLVQMKAYDRTAVARAYVDWFRADRREMEEATRSVLTLMDQGTPVDQAAREAYENATAKDADCAAVLRMVPLALLHVGNPEALVRDGRAEVALTHHGGEILSAALTYAFLLVGFLKGETDLDTVLSSARAHLDRAEPPVRNLPLSTTPVAETAVKIPPRATGRPGDDLEAVWAAVCASRKAGKVLTRVVSGGEDAATAGAMVGALMGARLGLDALPQDWVGGLLDRARFEQCAEGLFALAHPG